MKKKGFTLIETIISLVILGLVCIIVLSLIQNASLTSTKNDRNIEMLNIGEMVIENLSAFKYENESELYVFGNNLENIIESLNNEESCSLDISSGSEYSEEYNINISKEERSEKLWKIYVTVSYDKGERHDEIKYTTFITKK